MATANSNAAPKDNTCSAELSKLASELNDMAAQLSVFKPVLVEITDGAEGLSHSVSGQLEMIGTIAEYINFNLCGIADRLKKVTS